MKQLGEKGASIVYDEPFEGEGGWTLVVRICDEEFNLFVHWAPIGPAEDYWVIQIRRPKGVLAALFGRSAPQDVQPTADLVREILKANPQIRDVRWLTMEEFRQVY
jgi:hypothetical protein